MQELDTDIKFGEGISDEDLAKQIQDWIKESQTYHDYLLTRQQIAEDYYIGNQTAKNEVQEHLCNTVENRVFEGVETLVPIATSAAHNFTVMPGSEKETAVDRANTLQKVLDHKYRTIFMQRKLEESTRHMLLYRFGVMRWDWNFAKDDIDVVVVDPRSMLVPKLRCDPHDLPYKIEIQEFAPEEVEDYFPNVKESLWEQVKTTVTNIFKGEKRTESKKTFKVFMVWTADFVAWYANGKILKKEANPFYDYEGENFFDEPRDPYVFFTTFNVGDEPFGLTSLAETVFDIQDEINTQKRQIINNLKLMGNGRLMMDKDAMSDEDVEAITNEPGLVIRGEGLVSGSKYKVEHPMQLPNAFFANLQDSKVAFDNIMGLHSATRGAAASKTLGQDIISRQQDLTRIDLITRVLNRGVQRLAEGLVQLMKMFYTETHVFKLLGEDGAVEFVKLNSADIDHGTEIIVKSGKSPEFDRMQLATQAIQMWQLGALSPADLYRFTELPNPEQLEQNLLRWKQGQLSLETEAEVMKATAGAQAQASKQAEVAQAKGRGVETPENVMQRATRNVGGSAPIKGTPKM